VCAQRAFLSCSGPVAGATYADWAAQAAAWKPLFLERNWIGVSGAQLRWRHKPKTYVPARSRHRAQSLRELGVGV